MSLNTQVNQKFSDRSAKSQWTIIGVIASILFGGGGAAIVWAGDAALDLKYATDADVLAVQEQVQQQFESISDTVKANTATVQATANSVDGLTLVVLDLRIRDLDNEMIDMDRDRVANPTTWTDRDQRNLRDRQKALADLKIQRDRLFTRILENVP